MSLDHIRFVLVRPKAPGNVGAAARAMKNMGLSDLAVVTTGEIDSEAARTMAVHASDVLDGMKRHDGLAGAVADCGWAVATTGRRGRFAKPPLGLREASETIVERASANRVAVVFGPEDTGLTNEDLKLASDLVRIPSDGRYSSLNLAQAVLLVAYEIFLAAGRGVAPKAEPLAEHASAEALYEHLERAFVASGFLAEASPAPVLDSIRRLFGRGGLSEHDVRVWRALASHLEWLASGGSEILAEKRRRGVRLK